MIEQSEMMRQIIRYAHEEMRNRGIEESAQIIERCSIHCRGITRSNADLYALHVRALKRDPSEQLSNWYGPTFTLPHIPHLIPMAD